MDEARVRTLLEEAAERYNEGRYDEAIGLWREALTQDPENQKAREGIRMASLLVVDWDDTSPVPQNEAATVGGANNQALASRVEEGIARVRDLMAAGNLVDALEGCDLLGEIAPDLDEVKSLVAEVKRAAMAMKAAPAPAGAAAGGMGLEDCLERARNALADGRQEEAATAARRALAIDPANMEACGILSIVGEELSVLGPADSAAEISEPTKPVAVAPAKQTSAPASTAARIESLLFEGQAAFDAGRLQTAVETWSRIFALDQTNAEAGTRIDQAKAALEEQARHVDDLYYRAIDAREAGRRDDAIDLLKQVLAAHPAHLEASACLEELESGTGASHEEIPFDLAPAQSAAEKPAVPKTAPAAVAADPLASVPLAMPPPAAKRPAETVEVAINAPTPLRSGRRAGGGAGRIVMAICGVAALACAGVGGYLWFGSSTGSMSQAEATPVMAVPPQPGKHTETVTQPPAPTGRPAAATVEAPHVVAPGTTPPKTEDTRLQAETLENEGLGFYRQKRWAEAVLTLKKASQLDALNFDSQEQLELALVELEKQARFEEELQSATKFFGEADYAGALHKLYRLQQDDPGNKIFDTYIKNAWFNWGVELLQAGAISEAEEKLGEVIAIDPQDTDAVRAREVAQRYKRRQKDAALEQFAASLPPRRIDQP
ncbi:MAG TPA: hypothetical protein VFG76_01165 [Candidatus Polarisedimenticolia bacterium]|nr:hypothetical protein [Candidatus Polarisedimenticolia bacterium]